MPLNTKILRDGEHIDMPNGWQPFHVTAMICAAAWDSGSGPFEQNRPMADGYPEEAQGVNMGDTFRIVNYINLGMTPLGKGSYVLKGEHKFRDNETGEVLHLLPGDELKAWRS